MKLTIELLMKAIPIIEEAAQKFLVPLNDCLERWHINTPARAGAFLAQCAYESAYFRRVQENLNYSESGLLQTFPKRFTPAEAKRYARKPQAIANRVYASRFGNGDEKSGDGWRYRGRGIIQLTFKSNYSAYRLATSNDVLDKPDLLLLPHYAADSAGWYWSQRGLNFMADNGEIDRITKTISGSNRTASVRRILTLRARHALD